MNPIAIFLQHWLSLRGYKSERIRLLFHLFVPLAFIPIFSGCHSESVSPIKYARAVADRIIADASFDLEPTEQKPLVFPCILDATPFATVTGTGIVRASGTIDAKESGTYRFGFTADTTCTVYINGEKVFQTEEKGVAFPNEIAYDIYEFAQYKTIELKAQKNYFEVTGNGKISFGALDEAGVAIDGIVYKIENYRDKQGDMHEPPRYIQMRIKIPEYAAFKKHAYTEWHYANGTTMFGILSLDDQTGDPKYESFVKRYCLFTLENEPLFRRQYEQQNSLRTQNYRMFRCAMLDDSSAPALPFVEFYLRGFTPEGMKPLLTRMENFVMNVQPRLPDGTFVRPEPKWTLWADDLFMSSLFLLRYGRLTGEQRYYDEVVSQIIHYDRHLYDEEAKLYHHGWNVKRNEPLGQFWGRANGWLVWAVSEALLHLPESHPQYRTILGIHQRQLKNLAEYQDVKGMWHQVLNVPESYEETSCTAIFTMSMARAVRMGWIDRSYRKNALRGWSAIERMIDIKTGVVSGICESMPIGPDLNFYLNRGTKPNDPRGVGAVIASGVEIARLMND
ncbi:MAG: glycoside hydrolase family 88 protein [Porphyromonadaceae bacterium]|nr:glycoside hydrolase family 88 protein [Porphyromonadaceae bacterium]